MRRHHAEAEISHKVGFVTAPRCGADSNTCRPRCQRGPGDENCVRTRTKVRIGTRGKQQTKTTKSYGNKAQI